MKKIQMKKESMLSPKMLKEQVEIGRLLSERLWLEIRLLNQFKPTKLLEILARDSLVLRFRKSLAIYFKVAIKMQWKPLFR